MKPHRCICSAEDEGLNPGHNSICPIHQTDEDREQLSVAFDRVFAMSSEELGQAAVEAAKKDRGRN